MDLKNLDNALEALPVGLAFPPDTHDEATGQEAAAPVPFVPFPSEEVAKFFYTEFTEAAPAPDGESEAWETPDGVTSHLRLDATGLAAIQTLTDLLVPQSEFGQTHLSATPKALIAEHEASITGDKHEQIISQQFPDLPNPTEV